MRKESQEVVAEAARRRLELLRRELSSAGLEPRSRPVPDVPDVAAQQTAEWQPTEVAPSGRHLRRSESPAARAVGWCVDRLPPTLRGRVRLGARELALVVAVAAVGLAVAAVLVLRSTSGDPVPVDEPASSTGDQLISAPPVGSATASPGASPTQATTEVTVDVAGRVRRPGVVTLPAGSRVIDALHEAGGARGHVDLAALNLARVLTDGEQILVGRSALPGAAASAAADPGQPAGGPLVNINTATEEQLEQLPGVGPVTAQKILSWRGAHGSFSSVDELLEVDGIGEKTLADLAPYVTL